MTMRKYLVVLVVAAVAATFSAAAAERPNVILIMADDIGWECFPDYGGEDYETPNLDSLARKGVRFKNCFSTPICTPSRVKLMTGMYNFRNYTHFGYLNPKERTFG
ncbi:MAG: sulfatase-like hydrolase/transferase, partial [Planctomycetes bacterium]|nr:sulfatase-like hydrolase/transferase [Planctomycetota bacterium]